MNSVDGVAGDGSGAGTSTNQSTQNDGVDYKKAYEEYQQLKAALAQNETKQKEAERAKQIELEKSGKLAEALEAIKKRNAELESLEPIAKQWQSFEAAETKKMDAEIASMPDVFKDLYADANSFEMKRKVFQAAMAGKQTTTPTKGQPPNSGQPATLTAADYEKAFSDPTGKAVDEIKKRDPEGWRAWFNGIASKAKPNSSLGIGRFQAQSQPKK